MKTARLAGELAYALGGSSPLPTLFSSFPTGTTRQLHIASEGRDGLLLAGGGLPDPEASHETYTRAAGAVVCAESPDCCAPQ